MSELRPGLMLQLFERVAVSSQEKSLVALQKVALTVANQARINASCGTHEPNTPSPARPWTGPARISGTLAHSIAVSAPIPIGFGWSVRIGPRAGMVPYYSRRRVPADVYGRFLETDIRGGVKYPWLVPAVRIAYVTAYQDFVVAFANL